MSALDLSAFEAKVDSDELREFKAKVKKVADDYTKRHGWCREVKNALRDIGIEDEKPINVNVTTSFGLTIQAKTLPSKLIGKTEDEQKEIISKQLGALSLTGASGSAQLVITPEVIASMELATGQPTGDEKTLLTTPYGYRYIWRRMRDGRVLHLWQLNTDGLVDIHDQSDNVTSRQLYGTSVCGRVETNTYSQLATWTESDHGRDVCANCERRMPGMNLTPYTRERD